MPVNWIYHGNILVFLSYLLIFLDNFILAMDQTNNLDQFQIKYYIIKIAIFQDGLIFLYIIAKLYNINYYFY